MRFILQRLTRFVVVFVIVTFGVMVLLRLGLDQPGDPARTMLGGFASDAEIAATNARYHLHDNYLVQYVYWLKLMIVDRDFGYSVSNSMPVSTLIGQRIMTTLLLGTYALVISVGIAVPVAVYSAYKRDRVFDRAAGLTSFAFVALPAVVVAVFLKFLFVEHWALFPRVADKVYPWQDLGAHVHNFLLPTLTIALPTAAVLTRLQRSEMTLTLQSDFIGLARAKGLPPRRILWRHGLRNSLFTVLTSIGLQVGAIIGGAIVAETFFDLDGMGSLLITAVLGTDLFTVQAVVAILVVAVVVTNLVVDLLYGVIDPRVRLASTLQ